jgi:hypothetical protein
MKKINLLNTLILSVAFCLFANFASAQKATDTLTVKGEVLDMNCYMDHGAHGAKHTECASTCLKNGGPVGILTANGKVYLIVANHSNEDPYDEVKKHPGETIQISGTYANRGGVQAVIIASVKATN